FVLVFMVDGRKGVRETWPAILTAGFIFAVCQFAVSNYVSTQLTDIIASLVSAGAVVVLMRVWSPHVPGAPATRMRAGRPAIAGGATADVALERRTQADGGPPPSRRDMIIAFAPYLIIIAALGISSLHGISTQ